MKLCIACATLVALVTSAQAQQPGTSDAGTNIFNGVTFTASLRSWWVTFDAAKLDAQIVVGPNGSPLIQTSFNNTNQSSKLLPIVAVSATIDSFTLAASLTPDTKFDDPSVPGGKVGRREYDVSIGYSIIPGIAVSAIYKGGRLTRTYTTSAQNLLGDFGDVRLSGWLLGISGNAPMELESVPGLRLYGNVAVGRGTSKVDNENNKLDYLVSEVGFSWPFGQSWSDSLFKGGSLQIGYRAQTVNNRFSNSTLDPSTRSVIATTPVQLKSTTHGPIVGLVIPF